MRTKPVQLVFAMGNKYKRKNKIKLLSIIAVAMTTMFLYGVQTSSAGAPPRTCNGLNACLNNTGSLSVNSCNGQSACRDNSGDVGEL